jgi:hypothetical protein
LAIVPLTPGKIAWRPLLHQVLECEGVEAVMMAIKIDGRWQTAWSNDALGGLAMGAMKLFRDVSDTLEE